MEVSGSGRQAVAVVTGSAGTLGRAIVTALRESNFTVVATDARVPEEGDRRKVPADLWLPLDVRRMQTIERAKEVVIEKYGRVDVLVNNAGVFLRAHAVTLDEKKLEEILDVNLKGTLRCTAVFGAHMAQKGGGRVVNIASLGGERGSGSPLATAYAASKGGVIAATASLARELGPHGIRVNAVAPGRIEDIVELVAFLATCPFDYVNGTTLRADGGFSAG